MGGLDALSPPEGEDQKTDSTRSDTVPKDCQLDLTKGERRSSTLDS